jgi:hypothetical protein
MAKGIFEITDEKIFTCSQCHKKKIFPDMALLHMVFKGKTTDLFWCKKCWEKALKLGKDMPIGKMEK